MQRRSVRAIAPVKLEWDEKGNLPSVGNRRKLGAVLVFNLESEASVRKSIGCPSYVGKWCFNDFATTWEGWRWLSKYTTWIRPHIIPSENRFVVRISHELILKSHKWLRPFAIDQWKIDVKKSKCTLSHIFHPGSFPPRKPRHFDCETRNKRILQMLFADSGDLWDLRL